MNWQVSASGSSSEATIGLQPQIAEPEIRADLLESTNEAPEGDWLCFWCLNHVANDRDRFQLNGKSEFEFSNPDGVWFSIMTFSQTRGCRQSGVPTLHYTWFPGYAWSFCQCGRCGVHIGWHYSGLNNFAGLIKDRIVRAVNVRN